MSKKKLTLAVAAVAIVAIAFFFLYHPGEEDTDDAQIVAHVIPLMPKVSGYVLKVNIDDNMHVKKGDVLVEIDPKDFEISVNKAKAALEAAKARMEGSHASLKTTQTTSATVLASAEAAVRAAEANLQRASNDVKRLKNIGNEFVSRKQMDEAIASERDAASKLTDARAQLKTAATAPNDVLVAESSVSTLEANLAEAQAELETAERDLENTKIYASEDGTISNKAIEVGGYIQAGQKMAALVTPERWVVANFKETQLKKVLPGADVDIHVDAYPKLQLKGKVDSIQQGTGAVFSAFPPQNATGNYVKIVQRVPVKIKIVSELPPDVVLGPGMSVVPTVYMP